MVDAKLIFTRHASGEGAIAVAREIINALVTLGATGLELSASGTWLTEGQKVLLDHHNVDTDLTNPRVRTIGLGVARLRPSDGSVIRIIAAFEHPKPTNDLTGATLVDTFRLDIEHSTVDWSPTITEDMPEPDQGEGSMSDPYDEAAVPHE